MIEYDKALGIKTYGTCVSCGEKRTSRAWRGSTAKCWNKWSMCKECAKREHAEDYRNTWDWLHIECKCPGCGLVHKNPYQAQQSEPTYTEAQWKFKMEQEAKKDDAVKFELEVDKIPEKEIAESIHIPNNPKDRLS